MIEQKKDCYYSPFVKVHTNVRTLFYNIIGLKTSKISYRLFMYNSLYSRGGGMADTQVSKTCALNGMWVRLPPAAHA